jgi:hypothetical protein
MSTTSVDMAPGWPACALVNASPAVLPWLAHDSGLEWFANPFPCGSFIRYSLPVLTGVFANPFMPSLGDLVAAERDGRVAMIRRAA